MICVSIFIFSSPRKRMIRMVRLCLGFLFVKPLTIFQILTLRMKCLTIHILNIKWFIKILLLIGKQIQISLPQQYWPEAMERVGFALCLIIMANDGYLLEKVLPFKHFQMISFFMEVEQLVIVR